MTLNIIVIVCFGVFSIGSAGEWTACNNPNEIPFKAEIFQIFDLRGKNQ